MGLWGKIVSIFRPQAQSVAKEPSMDRAMNAGFTMSESSSRNFDWLDQYRYSSALRPPLHRVCKDAAMVRWNLFKDTADGAKRRKVRNHEILQWWRTPSPGMLGMYFRFTTLLHLDLCGNCFWAWEDENDITSPCVVLPVHQLQSLPTKGDPYYVFSVAGVTLRYRTAQVVWLKDPNPKNYLGLGIGLGDAMGADLQQLKHMSEFNSAFFRQGAHVGNVIGIEEASDEAWDRFEEEWKQKAAGVANAFKDHFISGKVSGVQMGAKHRDLDFVEGYEQKVHSIRHTVGTPAEIIGDSKDSNKATSYEAGNLHQTYGMWPRLEHLCLVVNDIVFPRFGFDRLALEFVDPIREKEELQAAKFEAGVSRGAVTIDEYRDYLDLDPLPGGAGQRVYAPLNTAPVLPEELDQVRDSLLQRKTSGGGGGAGQAPDTPPTSANQNGAKSILDKYLEAGVRVNSKSV